MKVVRATRHNSAQLTAKTLVLLTRKRAISRPQDPSFFWSRDRRKKAELLAEL